MYESEAGRRVRESFQNLAEAPDRFSKADAELLQARISDAVDELKAMSWPIERVIVRLKELAREVGVYLGNRNRDDADLENPVVGKAVLWCVQRYYKDVEPRR